MESEVNPSFEESCSRFSEFLASSGWPATIVWVAPDDVVLGKRRMIYIKPPNAHSTLPYFRNKFENGMVKRLGVLFETLCTAEGRTYCNMWVPANEIENEYGFMPRGPNALKMCIPTENSKFFGKRIRNRIWWKLVHARNKRYDELKRHIFFPAQE